MAVIQILNEEGSKVLDIPQERFTIGRAAENKVVLQDKQASRKHCSLEPVNGGFLLRDLGSRNGTGIKGKRIKEAKLGFGDAFVVGTTVLRILEQEVPEVEIETDDAASEETQADPALEIVDPEVSEGEALEALVAEPVEEDEEPLVENYEPSPEDLLNKARQDLNNLRQAGVEPGFGLDQVALFDHQGKPVHTASKDANASEAVRTLRLIFYGAFRTRATDIHFDPVREGCQIRFRVDGKMLPIVLLPGDLGRGLLSVVKVLSELNIAGRKDIQDGSFVVAVGRRVDCRVSLTPSMYGEKLVIRILDSATLPTRLDKLGLPRTMYKQFSNICRTDAGMIIVSGPTGSGKTTTLYTALRTIDSRSRNVVTIEDPIEYHIDGITQIQVDPKHGRDFAPILRSVLRQDPDVILVGEMRDKDTAKTALQAAMTGHLVFSTLHARDTIGSIYRLMDLGIETYMIANAVSMCLAQRLIRLLCDRCKKAYKPKPSQASRIKLDDRSMPTFYAPVGCKKCMGVGFWGRAAIFELLSFTDKLRDVLMTTSTIQDIREAAGEWSFQTLLESGYQKVTEGLTSIEEVERVATRESS
jgi:type II secretory ATPase GspE/PulE/Tfp pilus assembly ATPase PilB-like protein